jgi:hypothetical protein
VSGNNIQPYKDRVKTAHSFNALASKTALLHYLCLLAIYEQKYYIELGYNSMENYCKECWDYARSTAFRKLQTATKIQNYCGFNLNLNQSCIAGLLDLIQQSGIEKEDENYLSTFLSLPSEKQSLLSKLDQKDFNHLIKTGKTHFGSSQLTLDNVNEYSRDTLRRLADGEKRVVIKKEADNKNKPFELPFEIANKRINKYISNILLDIHNCDTFSKLDQQNIEEHLRAILSIYDEHEKTIQVIKNNGS